MTDQSVIKIMISKRETNKDEKRALIIDTALQLFSTEGYFGTSMSKIASTAGIAKGSTYNYFASKEDLLKAIINDGFKHLTESVDYLFVNSMDDKSMEKYIRHSFKLIMDKPNYWRLFFALAIQPSLPKYFMADIMQKMEPMFAKIAEYFASKGFLNPMAQVMLFVSTLDGVSISYLTEPENYPINDICEILVERYCK